MAVVHTNPGVIDVDAFMTFGLHAKPNSTNPIGHFGTGLKLAIAVLVRHGAHIHLWAGGVEYVFYTAEKNFRGKDFQLIRMKKRKGAFAKFTYHSLPFTTELGKEWKLWQAYRELHSNALDEGGFTYQIHSMQLLSIESTQTNIIVELPEYERVYSKRDQIFLSADRLENPLASTEHVQILEGESDSIFYRGLRIMQLKAPSQYTYNFITPVTLTEDRTAKYPWELEDRLVAAFQQIEDNSGILNEVVAKPKPTHYESRLGYTGANYYAPMSPSTSFMAAAKESTNVTAREFWEKQQPVVPDTTHITIKVPMHQSSGASILKLEELVHSLWKDAEVIVTSRATPAVAMALDTKPLDELDEIVF